MSDLIKYTTRFLLYSEPCAVDPLAFGDVEGGFYLLAAGIAVSIIVHCLMIIGVKMQNMCK